MRALKSKGAAAPKKSTALAAARLKYGIPALPYGPMGASVIVFRLPLPSMTAGGLHIPHVWTDTMEGTGNPLEPKKEIVGRAAPEPKGIIIGAGLAAMDIMRDAQIEFGDIVYFAKYAGWETEVSRDPENTGKDIIQMKVQDLLGSADMLERTLGPKARYEVVYDEETGEHMYKEVR
jgi:co-chaperonin GroES (HSP10)